MMADQKHILLAYNGEETSLPAVEYCLWLVEQIRIPITLLGCVERPADRNKVEAINESVSARLGSMGIALKTKIISGNCRRIICQHALTGHYLTVFGPFDRPKHRRLLRGRSFRRIFEEIDSPVLYVKQADLQLRKILVCLGGLGYAKNAELWGLFFAKNLGAAVNLLHVVEPMSYVYPTAREIQEQWENILETNTPQGENLREALKVAQEMDIPTTFQVRNGNIVNEIIREVKAQNYDLVVMGSPNSSHNLRHLFMPNVTAEIAEKIDCPVLAAPSG